jgi:hypothetical protein
VETPMVEAKNNLRQTGLYMQFMQKRSEVMLASISKKAAHGF